MGKAGVYQLVKLTALIGLFAVWAVLLRPQWLGGSTAYVMVRGDSMLPTFEDGALVVLQLQDSYRPDDVVGYLIPQGEVGAGQLVVHRIVSVEEDGGFVIAGDNNELPDPWRPCTADIRGRAVLAVPGAGRIIAMAMRPMNAGAIAAALIVMILVARSAPRGQEGRRGLRLGSRTIMVGSSVGGSPPPA
jgi:signal peptidase I